LPSGNRTGETNSMKRRKPVFETLIFGKPRPSENSRYYGKRVFDGI